MTQKELLEKLRELVGVASEAVKEIERLQAEKDRLHRENFWLTQSR